MGLGMGLDRRTGVAKRRGIAQSRWRLRVATLAFALAVLAPAIFGAQAAMATVLLGSQTVGGNLDNDSAGSAEAFGTTATTSGTVSSLAVYLDVTSQATKVVAGLYTENAGHPGTLLTQGSTTMPIGGAWNQIAVPAATVTSATKYWISVLGPAGTGEIQFRDVASGQRSESSSQSNLTSLPSAWTAGPDWSNSPISAYASGIATTAPPPAPPAAPTGVQAVSGNGSATVSWTAPSNEGSPITSYTVTPYVGSVAQAATTVPGPSPATNATVGGLANGTAYTFTVTATNAIGTGAPSAHSSAITPVAPPPPPPPPPTEPTTPTFVQQASAHKPGVSSVTLTPAANVTAGDRLVVEVGVWSSAGATAASVTDSSGNHYVELLHFKANDGTELSVWSAPVTVGGGTRPTISVKPTSTADTGVAVSEYAGLSTVADASVVDQMAHASGTTGGAGSAASGTTAATSPGNELAVGFYVDSGFGDKLTGNPEYAQRTNVSPTSEMEFVTEDRVVSAGATPDATVSTGANTTWLMATVVFKAAVAGPPASPAAPTGVQAVPGDGSATVLWTAPSNEGSPITSYTVTPYVGSVAQAATTIIGSPPATSATIGGLTNGTAYTFAVTATNTVGTGAPSAHSSAVTPSATPVGPVIDASTPAIVGIANDVTTAVSNSFSPPAASVIYAAFAMDSLPEEADAHVASVTNSGSALTWHLKGAEHHNGSGVGGYVEVWWAYNPTAQTNIDVTGNLAQPTKNVTPPIGALQVIVFKNAAADQTSAAWGANWDVGGGSAPNATVTTTAPNSLVFAVANNWDTSEMPTFPASQTTTINGQSAVVLNSIDLDTYWVQAERAPSAAGATVRMEDSAPSVRYHMLAWEVLAQ
jgi:hypothetical protein